MAPSAVDVKADALPLVSKVLPASSHSRLAKPLEYAGSLDQFDSFDVTSVIGREYPNVQLTDLLRDDDKLRDLALIISQRGVVFFRNQDIDIEGQKHLAEKLGSLAGSPESSGLYCHAVSLSKLGHTVDENGKMDDTVTSLEPESFRKLAKDRTGSRKLASHGWHADTTFENVPSDYSILKLVQIPEDAGGDTLWASGYEAYDRLSPALQQFVEGLTAVHYQRNFSEIKTRYGEDKLISPRGHPENSGFEFQAEHPVVRTNPVTGWKSLFAVAHQMEAGWFTGLTERESDIFKDYFLSLIAENHDLQVRFRWQQNDVAIWDNRSTFHTATPDYVGKRKGVRVLSIGEKPFLDPQSVSRRQALGLPL